MNHRVLLSTGLLLLLVTGAQAAGLVINEYTCVKDSEYLEGTSTYKGYDYGYFGEAYGSAVGGPALWQTLPRLRVKGNGDDWIELLVTEDYMDIRGWQIQWYEYDNDVPYDTDGRVLWQDPYNTDMTIKKHGVITFSDASLWSNLRRGTLITISEDYEQSAMTQQWDSGANEFVDTGLVNLDMRTNSGYGPTTGDWLIHVSTEHEQEKYVADSSYDRLITTDTTVFDDNVGQFLVNNDDWSAQIVDDAGDLVIGLVGEHLSANPPEVVGFSGGAGSTEAVSLENPADWTNPVSSDYDDHDYSSFGAANVFGGVSQQQDFTDLRSVVPTGGDANLDGEVDVGDLGILAGNWNASGDIGWAQADFNGDDLVDVGDLGILAGNWGYTETYPEEYTADGGPVPEPATMSLLAMGGLLGLLRRRNR